MVQSVPQSPWRVSEPIKLEDDDRAYGLKLRIVSALVTLPALTYLFVFLSLGLYFLFYALTDFPAFQADTTVLTSIAYIIFVVFGAYILALLSRPFFCLNNRDRGLPLNADKEVKIYTLVRGIANSLNLEDELRITVSMDISVDAFYQKFADYKSRRISLNLGLPLIHILSTEELAALIARELSRYAQPATRQGYSLTRSVIAWYHRVVNNDDTWDARLNSLSERDALRWLIPLLMPITLGNAAVNTLFRSFLSFAEAVSRTTIHETEFRADFIHAQVVGSENFEDALKRLVHIDQAYHSALELVLTQSSAPQNINKLIELQANNTQMTVEHLIEMVPAEHFNGAYFLPAPKSRSKRIEKRGLAKSSRMQGAASALFLSLNSLGVQLSDDIYTQYELGDKRNALGDTDASKVPRFTLVEEENVLRRFSSGLFRADIVWQPPHDEKIHNLPSERIKPFLNKVVASIRQNLPTFSKYLESLDEYHKVSIAYHFYKWLIKDSSKNRPDAAKIDAARHYLEDFEKRFKNTQENLIKAYGVRLAAAVAFGKSHKAYPSAKKLLLMLTRLAHLQALVADARVKASTMDKLMVRIKTGDSFHQASVSRLGKMLMKTIANMETTLFPLPTSLLGENNPKELESGKLNLDELNGAEYEKVVLDRFAELVAYYEAYNIAISAKLAKFVETMEKKHGVDSVVKVNLQNTKPE